MDQSSSGPSVCTKLVIPVLQGAPQRRHLPADFCIPEPQVVNTEVQFACKRQEEANPLTKTRGQRGKAASGSLDHLQWLCPDRVHLPQLGSRSLITACNHLMTACPSTTQGSHHQTPKDPGSASQTAAPTWNPTATRKGGAAGAWRRFSCYPCSANSSLCWRVGLGGSKASLKHPPGASWGWAWQQHSQPPYIHGTKSSTVTGLVWQPQGIIQGDSNCPLEKQKPGVETSCILNDNGADSFKSSQGLFKALLPCLRELFRGQDRRCVGRGAWALQGNEELLPCWAFPLLFQLSRHAFKVRQVQKPQCSSLWDPSLLWRTPCLYLRASTRRGSARDSGTEPCWMGG